MCDNTNSNVTRNTKKMSHSHVCSRKPHKKRLKSRHLPILLATPPREQCQPVNASSVRLALSTTREEAGVQVQPTGLPSLHRPDRRPRVTAIDCSVSIERPAGRTARSLTPQKHRTPDDRGRQPGCRLVHAVRAARTALCPASPSFLECTPRSGRGSRGYIGGTGGVATNVPRSKPKGSSGVKRTSRCHWERASWFPGAKRAWRARASGRRCGW